MDSHVALYHITRENLALRRQYIGLDDETVALVGRLQQWAETVADAVAGELTDHHFKFPATRQFFRDYAQAKGIELAALQNGWQAAQAGHWRAIFAEPARREPFGIEYFEGLLGVGALHNKIDLPLKWYLGSYPTFLDAVRRELREHPPELASDAGSGKRSSRDRSAVLADAERAIGIVFNYDLQAITDAFYFDTFATLGVDLERISTSHGERDLSDNVAELKSTVSDTLQLFIDSTREVHDVVANVRGSVEQSSRALSGIMQASNEVAHGAERQAEMLQRSRELSEDVSSATTRAQELGQLGVEAAGSANSVMLQVRSSGQDAQEGIEQLAQKSTEIGGILETITGIASQTNLLALNAAIEAARAGEQGRGFAVVAEEVRKLAEESARSATTIAQLVEEIQRGIDSVVVLVRQGAELAAQGVESSERAQQAFGEIGQAITTISEQVNSMGAATSEIAAVAEQSSASAEEMSSATQQTTSQSEQITTSLAELAATADGLLGASQRFVLRSLN
jgi:methyl-accepting chemotaxis protein